MTWGIGWLRDAAAQLVVTAAVPAVVVVAVALRPSPETGGHAGICLDRNPSCSVCNSPFRESVQEQVAGAVRGVRGVRGLDEAEAAGVVARPDPEESPAEDVAAREVQFNRRQHATEGRS